jgi:hypothetical protein
MPKAWEPAFPYLGVYECHSPPTPIGGPHPRYNCYAFAAGENSKRWEPDPSGQCYWPPGILEITEWLRSAARMERSVISLVPTVGASRDMKKSLRLVARR